MNIDALARDTAADSGVPDALIPSVVVRVHEAKRAVESLARFTPLGDGLRVLVRRVVARAAADHRAGVLERTCA